MCNKVNCIKYNGTEDYIVFLQKKKIVMCEPMTYRTRGYTDTWYQMFMMVMVVLGYKNVISL